MPTMNVEIDIIQSKLQRAVDIGQKHFRDIIGTDQEKEYDRILRNIGIHVLMAYKNGGRDGWPRDTNR